MKRASWILLAIAAAAAPVSNAQTTDVLVEQLRQDVRELNRVVREQARQIERLEREIARLKAARVHGRAPASGTPPADLEAPWLAAAQWKKLREGMREAEVVALLGPPVAMRGAPPDKTLLYTLELEGTGFLSGSVVLVDGQVAEIREPQLR